MCMQGRGLEEAELQFESAECHCPQQTLQRQVNAVLGKAKNSDILWNNQMFVYVERDISVHSFVFSAICEAKEKKGEMLLCIMSAEQKSAVKQVRRVLLCSALGLGFSSCSSALIPVHCSACSPEMHHFLER